MISYTFILLIVEDELSEISIRLPIINDLQEEKINDILRRFANKKQEQKPLTDADTQLDTQACMHVLLI